MKLIKIYDKDFSPLTALSEGDFSSLIYSRVLGGIGDCQFNVILAKEKITEANINLYNRIEIIEDGVVKFVGIIIHKTVNLDTALVKCLELTYILKHRLVGATYSINTNINTAVTNLLNTINGVETTGISLGTLGASGNINSTFSRADAFTILKQIIDVTENQFILSNDRKISINSMVGEDKTASVILRYDIGIISASNILTFRVEEDGENIVTKVYGESGSFTSAQTDNTLKNEYGLLEKYHDFRVANTQTVLDEFTLADIRDKIYSPTLELNPETADNFDIGDRVRIVLKNSLVDIDDSFQVLQKKVEYIGNQKKLTVQINDLPNSLAIKLADRDARLSLLEQSL